MSEQTKCPKCDGEMRKGEILVNVKAPSGGLRNLSPMMGGYSAMGLPFEPGNSTEGVLWQEYTGEKKGWLIKQKEVKTLSLKGKRCLECGYVELFVTE
jgi:predicted nucleic-acid-binding Zn-ribbon protein